MQHGVRSRHRHRHDAERGSSAELPPLHMVQENTPEEDGVRGAFIRNELRNQDAPNQVRNHIGNAEGQHATILFHSVQEVPVAHELLPVVFLP